MKVTFSSGLLNLVLFVLQRVHTVRGARDYVPRVHPPAFLGGGLATGNTCSYTACPCPISPSLRGTHNRQLTRVQLFINHVTLPLPEEDFKQETRVRLFIYHVAHVHACISPQNTNFEHGSSPLLLSYMDSHIISLYKNDKAIENPIEEK